MSARDQFPEVASFVDDLRDQFGEARVLYAAEGDQEAGRRIEREHVGTTCDGAADVYVYTETPASRSSDPKTSHAAEAEHTASGKRAAQQRQAADAVRQWPGRTSSELARLSGMDRHALGRRLPEIEAGEGPGQVVRAGERRDPETGRSGVRWWPVEVAFEHMARRIVENGKQQVADYRQQYGSWVADKARARAVELWRQREVA